MLIFGHGTKAIGAHAEPIDAACDHCGQHAFRVLVFQRYFHLYWIIQIPLSKRVLFECTHCQRAFEVDHQRAAPSLRLPAHRALAAVTTPWTMYAGLAAVTLLLVIAAVSGS